MVDGCGLKATGVFSFRVPSIKTVDFVKEANALNAAAQKRAKRKAKRAKKKRPPKWERKR